MMDVAELLELLEELTARVGFGKMDDLKSTIGFAPGEADKIVPRHYLWNSAYAKILLMTTDTQDPEILCDHIETAQDRLDAFLAEEEQDKHAVVDGYLLVALESIPSPAIIGLIRKYELDTHLCRKHILWPESGDTAIERWRRVLRSTVLALPEAAASGSQIVWPDFDGEYHMIWRQISKSGSAAAAARKYLKG